MLVRFRGTPGRTLIYRGRPVANGEAFELADGDAVPHGCEPVEEPKPAPAPAPKPARKRKAKPKATPKPKD